VHGLPQLLACLDVEKRHGEEGHGEQEHYDILHSESPKCSQTSVRPDFVKEPILNLAEAFSAPESGLPASKPARRQTSQSNRI